jgi:DNA-directed RNA polymerase I subunit RPA49
MATAKKVSKKRKRDSNSSEGLVFKLATPPSNPIGPLLGAFGNESNNPTGLSSSCHLPVSYPSLQPPTTTPFRCYARKKARADVERDNEQTGSARRVVDDQDLLVVGESDNVEFVSAREESQRAADAGCRSVYSPVHV